MPCREWRVSRNDLEFLGRISIGAVKLPLELPWEVPAFPKRSLLCSQTVPRPGVDDVPAEDQMIFNDLFAQTLLQQSCTSGRMVGWMYLYWTDCNCIFYIAAHTHTHGQELGAGTRAKVHFGLRFGSGSSEDAFKAVTNLLFKLPLGTVRPWAWGGWSERKELLI